MDSLGIYVMSYKRSDKILTGKLIPSATYFVRKSEEDAYRAAGIERIWAVEDEQISNAIKTYWHIVQNAPEDIVFVADDDIKAVCYRLDKATEIEDPETILDEIVRIAQLMVDLRVGYAAIDATGVPYGYDGPFAVKGTSGSMKWVNKRVFKAKPDESVRFNYDLDLILQELMLNRIVLKPRYIVGRDFQDVNAGGDSGKLRQDQLDSIMNMRRKWGKYFFYNFKNNRPNIRVAR